MTDTYTHALTAYALSLYKPDSRFTDIVINRLLEKAIIEGSVLFISSFGFWFEGQLCKFELCDMSALPFGLLFLSNYIGKTLNGWILIGKE